MRVEQLSVDPLVLLLHDFVSDEEARALVRATDGHFNRSTTVCEDPNGCAIPERTSASARVPENPTANAVQERGKTIARAPSAEPIQIVRYQPGQEFKPHLDAFDASSGEARALAEYDGKQRDATILIYLVSPEAGGETVFPKLGLSVAPMPRAALYWRNVLPDGSIDQRMLHGGAPVHRGVKYAANLWLRGKKDPIYELAQSENVMPPTTKVPRAGKDTVVIAGIGAAVGGALGGAPGAVVGGTVGCALDAIRRRLIAPA